MGGLAERVGRCGGIWGWGHGGHREDGHRDSRKGDMGMGWGPWGQRKQGRGHGDVGCGDAETGDGPLLLSPPVTLWSQWHQLFANKWMDVQMS